MPSPLISIVVASVILFLLVGSFLGCIIQPRKQISFSILGVKYEGPLAGIWPVLLFATMLVCVFVLMRTGV